MNLNSLSAEKAAFLAGHWAKPLASGEIVLLSDPRHKIVNPHLFRIDEAIAAGALGVSTSRTIAHMAIDGEPGAWECAVVTRAMSREDGTIGEISRQVLTG